MLWGGQSKQDAQATLADLRVRIPVSFAGFHLLKMFMPLASILPSNTWPNPFFQSVLDLENHSFFLLWMQCSNGNL